MAPPTHDDERAARARMYDAVAGCATVIAQLLLLLTPIIDRETRTAAADVTWRREREPR